MISLKRASQRLALDRVTGEAVDRLQLLHGALTYRDDRLKGFDAATLVEVIEHLDEDRLPALGEALFGHARPHSVIVTTPNAEHNALFENMAPGAMRHPDHRFEWTRAQFGDWIALIENRYGYVAVRSEIGQPHETLGAPTQMAVFTRGGAG
jgi:3' terminal RNA ribose 2'-O-methyltransferase Hen1